MHTESTAHCGLSNDQNKQSLHQRSIKTDTHFPWFIEQDIKHPHLTDKTSLLILGLTAN